MSCVTRTTWYVCAQWRRQPRPNDPLPCPCPPRTLPIHPPPLPAPAATDPEHVRSPGVRAMALGLSSPCSSRSGRPRPTSFLGIIALLSGLEWLRPFYNQPYEGGAGGGGGRAGSDVVGEANPVPTTTKTKGLNNEVAAERIHSNDNRDGHIIQLLAKILDTLASIDNSMQTLVNGQNRLITKMENLLATSTSHVVANKAVNRMKGLLGAMHSIADKLFMFTASVLPWLLSNSPAQNSSAPKATQNFEDPLMQVLIIGSLMLYQMSFVTMFLASKFKDSESIDGVRFNIYIGLLLLVSIGFWSELCMILHNFAHISKYVMWPVGIFVSIFLVAFFFFEIYMEKQKILKELKEGCVPANGVLPERILNPRLPLPTV